MKSIKCQFQHSINMNFRENIDKHAHKQNGAMNGSTSIFSYNEKFRLLDVSSNLSNFLKANYPNVKYIRDIQPMHIQEFLNSKKDCTQQTINSYIQSLKKLERVSNCKRQVLSSKKWQLISSTFWQLTASVYRAFFYLRISPQVLLFIEMAVLRLHMTFQM